MRSISMHNFHRLVNDISTRTKHMLMNNVVYIWFWIYGKKSPQGIYRDSDWNLCCQLGKCQGKKSGFFLPNPWQPWMRVWYIYISIYKSFIDLFSTWTNLPSLKQDKDRWVLCPHQGEPPFLYIASGWGKRPDMLLHCCGRNVDRISFWKALALFAAG